MYYGKHLRQIVERLTEIGKKIDEYQNAQRDGQKAADQKWSEVPSVIASNILGTTDEKKANEAYREKTYSQQERLIAPQEKLVFWTRLAFIAAAIYAAVAAWQGCEMKQATDAAVRSAQATESAAKTSTAQFDLERNQLIYTPKKPELTRSSKPSILRYPTLWNRLTFP
jgi:hypothetical protein